MLCPCFCVKTHVNVTEVDVVYKLSSFGLSNCMLRIDILSLVELQNILLNLSSGHSRWW